MSVAFLNIIVFRKVAFLNKIVFRKIDGYKNFFYENATKLPRNL